MGPRWAVVDKLVHELGSLRAVVQDVEAVPQLADADVTTELRASLAHAADTIHLVIGGDDGMVAQAWRTIAEAQEVGARARAALQRSRTTAQESRTLLERARATGRQSAQRVEELQALGGKVAPSAPQAGSRPAKSGAR